MRKFLAFLIALLFVLILSNTLALFHMLDHNLETALVQRVIDGDTLVLSDGRTLRLANINSPEKSSFLSKEAITFMKRYENKSVQVEIVERDKYNRFVARVYSPIYINAQLVSLGLASKFLVYDDEKSEFARLEQEAIDKERGIWEHSPYFHCIRINVDAIEEMVEIDNACGIYLGGFYIKDESRKTYKLLNISSPSIIIRTGDGTDTSEVFYWHSSNVWNNDRDSAYMFDSQNRLAAYYSYGY